MSIFCLFKFTILGTILVSCFRTPLAPEQDSPNIKIKFAKIARAPTEGWLPNIINRIAGGLPRQADVDEARIAILNLRQWSSGDEFVNAWFGSNQTALIDTTKWDDDQDFWDNAVILLQSYTGDFYRFAGDFTLSVEGDTARGTVNASPGLNYFLIALREKGTTQDWGEAFLMVNEDEENVLCFGCGAPVVRIASPADGSIVTTNVITVEGTVSDDTIKTAILKVDNLSLEIPVTNGTFSNSFVLSVGVNTITVEASNASGTGSDQVSVEFQGQPAALRATLVWNTSGTDMDLQMENPNGEVCSFVNPDIGGMKLDVDDADGIGPENISVNQPLTGNYTVRVKYFSNNGGGVTKVRVFVLKEETLIANPEHTFLETEVGDTWEAGVYSWP